jgi:rare lipoprotein A
MIMSTTFAPLFAKGLAAGAAALQLACSSPETAARHSKPALASAPTARPTGHPQHGIASIYTDHRTASGERFSRHALTAAHRHLPLGCTCKVTNLLNGKSCIVRINDRGPYIRGRIIDLTPAAAAQIGLGHKQGLAKVKVEKM